MSAHCPFRDQHPYMTSCGCGYGRRPSAAPIEDVDDLTGLLATARVLHLQPDDQIVIEMDRPLTPELALRIRDAFVGRRVTVLDRGITFDVKRSDQC